MNDANHNRLCFYPSSGDRALWVLMRLDCDLFVMADKRREAVSWRRIQADFKKQGLPIELVEQGAGHLCFRSQGKTAWIFIEDNNVTLERLHRARLTIHYFELVSLIPFRIQSGCGVLAEYRVFWERDWDDGSGRVGYI